MPIPVRRSPLPPALRWLGAPLAGLFAAGVAVRRCAYACGMKRSRRASVPVISVGNLTAGGTGKTPAVAYLARGLMERGRKPAIVLRGYGAPVPGELNDEGRALVRDLPGVPTIANPDRFAGAEEAVRKGADVVVLDDGFQHWALARDFDLVLLDATDPFGGGHRLPWGYQREAPSALARAHAVLITRADRVSTGTIEELRKRIGERAPSALIGTACHQPAGLRALSPAAFVPDPRALRGVRLFAVCGLARPEHFHATLAGLGVDVAGRRSFPDHYSYTTGDVQACLAEAKTSGASAVIITEKDAAKWGLLPDVPDTMPVWVLRIAFTMADGERQLWQAVDAAIQPQRG